MPDQVTITAAGFREGLDARNAKVRDQRQHGRLRCRVEIRRTRSWNAFPSAGPQGQ